MRQLGQGMVVPSLGSVGICTCSLFAWELHSYGGVCLYAQLPGTQLSACRKHCRSPPLLPNACLAPHAVLASWLVGTVCSVQLPRIRCGSVGTGAQLQGHAPSGTALPQGESPPALNQTHFASGCCDAVARESQPWTALPSPTALQVATCPCWRCAHLLCNKDSPNAPQRRDVKQLNPQIINDSQGQALQV